MERQIIKIDREKCNGCGLCITACHEGAIGMVDGKAQLMRDDYCDGLGNCLPVCPTNAISFEKREALPFNEEAVKANQAKQRHTPPHKQETSEQSATRLACGCPSSNARRIIRPTAAAEANTAPTHPNTNEDTQSELNQWPIQIKLIPTNAAYLRGAKLLIAADCAAYAYGNFHKEYIKGRVVVIGCPKLDAGDYSEKLTEILRNNEIKSVDIVRMEVPCCGGIEAAAKEALRANGKMIPWQVHTIGIDGEKKH